MNSIATDLGEVRKTQEDVALFDESLGIVEKLCESPDDELIAHAADLIRERDRSSRETATGEIAASLDGLRDLMRAATGVQTPGGLT